MSIPDDLIIRYFELATEVDLETIKTYKEQIDSGENPVGLKKQLAKDLVTLYHDEKAADKAAEEFTAVFANKGLPEDIEVQTLDKNSWNIVEILAETGLVSSKSEARRLVQGGGAKVNGEKVPSIEEEINITEETLIQAGKRKFLKVVSNAK